MKALHLSAALAVLFLLTTGALAQDRNGQQFNQHDRQVANDWYNQHKSNPPRGMRAVDQLTPEQEQRLQTGQPLDRELQQRSHSVPRDLSRQLSRAPKNHKYVVVGHHVALVDSHSHVVRDVIHLHD